MMKIHRLKPRRLLTLISSAAVVTGSMAITQLPDDSKTITEPSGTISKSLLFSDNVMEAPSGKPVMRSAGIKAKPQPMAPTSETSQTKIGGAVIYSDSGLAGVYTFPLENKATMTPLSVEQINASCGGVLTDNKYYAAFQLNLGGAYINYAATFDAQTWNVIDQKQVPLDIMGTALAYDPTDSSVYGCFSNSEGSDLELGILDVDNFTRTTISGLSKRWIAAGVTSAGILYALADDMALYKVNKSTGAMSYIGDTNLTFQYTTSGTIDPSTDTFYYAVCTDEEKAIYKIDLQTAKTTWICAVPDGAEITGMFIARPQAEEKAPDKVRNLTAEFNNDDLEGNLVFDMPQGLFNGEPAEGNVNYTIELDSKPLNQGVARYGEHVSVPVSVDGSGEYVFNVYASNTDGAGPKSTLRIYIGADTPTAPRNLKSKLEGTKMCLTWDAPEGSVNNGYINPDDITYIVTRYFDGTVVGDHIKDTSLVDEVVIPESLDYLFYTVEAEYKGNVSKFARTRILGVGNIYPPFYEYCDWDGAIGTFDVIDANGDGRTWYQDLTCIQIDSSSDSANDDWMISKPIVIEKIENEYDFTFYAANANPGHPEYLEIFFSDSPEVESMTNCIFGPVEIRSNYYGEYVASFRAPAPGKYYLGIHSNSPAGEGFLAIQNISISEGLPATAPAAGKMKVVPDPRGELKANISITLPETKINGDPLDLLTRIDIKRQGSVIYTSSDVKPGQTIEFTDDKVTTPGYYDYTLECYGTSGKGKTVKVTSHVGPNLPGRARNVRLVEDPDNLGKVTLSWDDPDTDCDGNPYIPTDISYNIIDIDGNTILSDFKGNSTTLTAVSANRRDFAVYIILSRSEVGVNGMQYATSDLIPVGQPYKLPYAESFANSSLSTNWATLGDGTFDLSPASITPQALSQDSDGGLCGWKPSKIGDKGTLLSSKIDLTDCDNPVLSFFYHTVKGSSNDICVEVAQVGSDDFNQVGVYNLGDTDKDGWVQARIPLTEYQGKQVVVRLVMSANDLEGLTLIDNIRIARPMDYDLSIKENSIPAVMYRNVDNKVEAVIQNIGINEMSAVVELTANYKTVDQVQLDNLKSGEESTVTLSFKPDAYTPSPMIFEVRVTCEHDNDTDNNFSPEVMVCMAGVVSPAVDDLSATINDQNEVNLTWSVPNLTKGTPIERLEAFDAAVPLAIDDIPGWTTYDGDDSETFKIAGNGVNFGGVKSAWQVIDTYDSQLGSFHSFAGSKCLASISAYSGQNDDWLISPLLSGRAQKIGFYATSLDNMYGLESFEVLVSDKSNSPEDFRKVMSVDEVPATWTEYSFDVEAGTKYFAVRCTSADRLMLLVDAFSFEQAIPETLELTGINVFANKAIVTTLGKDATTFSHKPGTSGSFDYNVSLLFANGESALSNTASVTLSGVDEITHGNVSIKAEGSKIIISEAEGMIVNITDLNGHLLSRFKCNSNLVTIPVISGIYIVTADETTAKLLVK